jgi:hypothetical protein
MSGERSTVPVVNTQPCDPRCTRHRSHVYVICYGEPFIPDQADLGYPAYPVTHYVGFTEQHPPLRRVQSHGRGSTAGLVEIRTGTLRDEARIKCLEKCARCGESLWYYRGEPGGHVAAAGGLFINPRENHVRLYPGGAPLRYRATGRPERR